MILSLWRHARLWIFWNDNEQWEIIMSHVFWWPMREHKMQSLWFCHQWVIGKMGQGGTWVLRWNILGKISWKLLVVSMVLFCIGWNAKCCEFSGQPVGKVCQVWWGISYLQCFDCFCLQLPIEKGRKRKQKSKTCVVLLLLVWFVLWGGMCKKMWWLIKAFCFIL